MRSSPLHKPNSIVIEPDNRRSCHRPHQSQCVTVSLRLCSSSATTVQTQVSHPSVQVLAPCRRRVFSSNTTDKSVLGTFKTEEGCTSISASISMGSLLIENLTRHSVFKPSTRSTLANASFDKESFGNVAESTSASSSISGAASGNIISLSTNASDCQQGWFLDQAWKVVLVQPDLLWALVARHRIRKKATMQ